jgi:hypothetical protein
MSASYAAPDNASPFNDALSDAAQLAGCYFTP